MNPIHRLVVLCAFLTASARADWGLWDAGLFLELVENQTTLVRAETFNGSTLGDYSSTGGQVLRLRGAQTKSWKNGSSSVLQAICRYRCYSATNAPGEFTALDLPWFSRENSPYGSINETWQTTNETINLLEGLSRGTYILEFYASAAGTSPATTNYYSNYENNFKATFNVDMPTLTVNGINANYTTSKFFIDEPAGESLPLRILFRPNAAAPLTHVEIFSNLNRRDLATLAWTNADGIATEEGICPPPGNTIVAGATNHYFQAWPMETNALNDEYSLTLHATKTGAYRLSARYKTEGDTNWHWYTDPAMNRRDHAVVVSPKDALDIVMYELNTLNIRSTGITHEARSTFADLLAQDDARPSWSLDYVRSLGVNWLWFQPVHPYAEDGRHLSAADINSRAGGGDATTWLWNDGAPYLDTNYPYALGSPYAVKNFFEIEPRMSRGGTRDDALDEFTRFVQAADEKGVRIMLDAAFNHTAWDVELGPPGVPLFAPGASPTSEIRQIETRFFSRLNAYDQRAENSDAIAPAPDRFDFGKWLDVKDVFFGRYAALVPSSNEVARYQNEEDWFDYTAPAPGHFDQITHNIWKYFGAYVPYRLEKTGHDASAPPSASQAGIDGLRCDFGQGLPPQAWEYIINRARSVKWNFVFMAETLDGGAPPYRSNRHFDLLNENILFALKDTTDTDGFRALFEQRRNAFGYGLVLLNTTSHDEANYADPWQALLRYALCSTQDGAPMLFAGQELGLTTQRGYELMERNFGKFIPHFKTWNSMMPLWNRADSTQAMLSASFAAIGRARAASPALRSHNRYFINQTQNRGSHSKIFSVAKYETALASPVMGDVVIAFVNLDPAAVQTGTFDLNLDLGEGHLLGIRSNRLYNVRNLAAFTALQPGRDQEWLWGAGRAGKDILDNGITVSLPPLPSSEAGWDTTPYEALFLKLYDVTTPTPAPANGLPYALGDSVTFAWNEILDPSGHPVTYRVILQVNGAETATNLTSGTSHDAFAATGDTLRLVVQPIGDSVTGSYTSTPVLLLDPDGDYDGDRQSSRDEDYAGTDPTDPESFFAIQSQAPLPGGDGHAITVRTEPLRHYAIEFADTLPATGTWARFANPANGIGTWLETNNSSSTRVFIDDASTNTTLAPPPHGQPRFYRFEVTHP